MPRDRAPQPGVAARLVCARRKDRGRTKLARDASPPRRHRKEPRIGSADAKVVGDRRRRGDEIRLGRGPQRPRAQVSRRRAPIALGAALIGGDEGPVANATDEEALGGHPLVRDRDGVARHAELAGQFSRGRQAIAAAQTSVDDGIDELTVDADRQVAAPFQAHMEVHGSNLIGPVENVNIGPCGGPLAFL